MNISLPTSTSLSVNTSKRFSVNKKRLALRSETTKGFTLIELLVVIAIIAVLAIMGFAAFRGFTGRANDDRRSADLKAIGDALEAAKGQVGVSSYAPLATNQFASGNIPQDPIGLGSGSTIHQGYCISYTTGSNPVIPTTPTTTGSVWSVNGICTTTGGVTGTGGVSTGYSQINPGSTPATGTTAWQVCAALGDNTTITTNTPICRNSAQ